MIYIISVGNKQQRRFKMENGVWVIIDNFDKFMNTNIFFDNCKKKTFNHIARISQKNWDIIKGIDCGVQNATLITNNTTLTILK